MAKRKRGKKRGKKSRKGRKPKVVILRIRACRNPRTGRFVKCR